MKLVCSDVDADQHREPDEVDAEELERGRGDQQHEDEGDLEEFEEEGEAGKIRGVDEEQESCRRRAA